MSRNYRIEMTALVLEEVNKASGNRDLAIPAIVQRVQEDAGLKEYLLQPRLLQIISEWVADCCAAVRVSNRPENATTMDAVEAGSSNIGESPFVRDVLRNVRNGRQALERALLDIPAFGKAVREWAADELKEKITKRKEAIATEGRDLKFWEAVCDFAQRKAGKPDVVVGNVVSDAQAQSIYDGEEPGPAPRKGGRRTRTQPSAQA